MEVERVGIVGMGTMGSQIGIVCARGGFQTVTVDVSNEVIEKGLSNIRYF
jgi:3-hydroxybutyryl-CoA dehydrogenase